MRRKFSLFIFLIVSSTFLHSQVIYKSKSTVDFTDIGFYSVEQSTWTTAEQMRSDEKTEFKGKGIIKGTLAKIFLRSGETGQILQPLQKRIVGLDHKKKEFWVDDITQINLDSLKNMTEMPDETDEAMEEPSEETPEAEAAESDFEIIRSEFSVEKAGESKSVNGFDCELYNVVWVMEWRVKSTGETGTDSLHTAVWTTPQTDDMHKAQQIQSDFAMTELGAMGIDMEEIERENVLGLHWLQLLGQINQERSQKPTADSPEWVNELQKLEGYPIVVDGKYFVIRPKTESEQAEEESSGDPTDVKGALGGFMKKKVFGKKKKEDSGPKPVFAWTNEVFEYRTGETGSEPFEIPGKYKERKQKN